MEIEIEEPPRPQCRNLADIAEGMVVSLDNANDFYIVTGHVTFTEKMLCCLKTGQLLRVAKDLKVLCFSNAKMTPGLCS